MKTVHQDDAIRLLVTASSSTSNGTTGNGPGSGSHDPEKMELLQMSGPSYSTIAEDSNANANDANHEPQEEDDIKSTLASVAGNVLEWYDFAIYGYFSDILGSKFFPPTHDKSTAIMESFLVFGGAFFVRPVGGILMGYIGDTLSRKRALELR